MTQQSLVDAVGTIGAIWKSADHANSSCSLGFVIEASEAIDKRMAAARAELGGTV
jgi:hypothetical protein